MASTSTKVVRRRDRDRTQRRLLSAAIQLFSSRGFHGVSVDEIVARAKANKRMVYHYFGSKEDIYHAALVEVLSRLEQVEFRTFDTSSPPDEKLRDLLAAYFAFLDDNPQFVRMLLWENLEMGRHLARASQGFTKNPFMERFRAVINEGIDKRIFRAPHDINHLMINFIGLCFVYYSNPFSLAASLGLDLQSDHHRNLRLKQAMDLVFHGLLAE